MDNYIVINGKKAELTPEQLKALGIEPEKKSPFERADKFYRIDSCDKVCETIDIGHVNDTVIHYSSNLFNVANYCTDKDLLQQQAYRETLNRLLWRFSMEHDGDKIDWNNNSTQKHFIYYTHMSNEWKNSCYHFDKHFGVVYFYTSEAAKQAIEEIVKPFIKTHPDFNYKGE